MPFTASIPERFGGSANDAFDVIVLGVRAYETHTDLLDNEALDLVVIASPTIYHLEHAVALGFAGRNVPAVNCGQEPPKQGDTDHNVERKVEAQPYLFIQPWKQQSNTQQDHAQRGH